MQAAVASNTFTRPNDTTAYASGDLVANSTTAASVTPLTLLIPTRSPVGRNIIRRVRVNKSGNGITNSAFRVHFYSSSPTLTNGDNGSWLSSESGYLGSVDVTADKAFNDSAGPAVGYGANAAGAEIGLPIKLGGTGNDSLFALIEARGAYTPAAQEVFSVIAEVSLGED